MDKGSAPLPIESSAISSRHQEGIQTGVQIATSEGEKDGDDVAVQLLTTKRYRYYAHLKALCSLKIPQNSNQFREARICWSLIQSLLSIDSEIRSNCLPTSLGISQRGCQLLLPRKTTKTAEKL